MVVEDQIKDREPSTIFYNNLLICVPIFMNPTNVQCLRLRTCSNEFK